MANKIKPKRSYTANAVPTTSDLDTNELAVNWADNKAFTKNAAGNIISVTLGGGGSSSIVTAATVAGFPATGSANTLYLATDTARIYEWQGAYVECGVSGGGSGFPWSSVPASATATGTAGSIAYDGSYLYLASASNTWVRAPLSTWTTYKVYDSFTGADNTALTSHTPDIKPTGASWNFLGTASDSNTGNFVISSNRLLNTVHPGNGNNSTSKAWINSGSANATLSAVLSLGSKSNVYALGGFIFRYVDSSNYVRLDIGRDGFDTFGFGWTIRLLAIVNGSSTVVATAGTGTDLTRDTEYTLTASVAGNDYTASIGGVTLSASSSANASATSHGLFIDNTVSRGTGNDTYFDNFAVI